MLLDIGKMGVGACFFKSSSPQMAYETDTKTGKRIRTNRQETTEDGTPLWIVKAGREDEAKGGEEIIAVSVPVKRDPAEGLQLNEELVFVGMKLESGIRRDGRRWLIFHADNIVRKKRGE